MKLVDKIKIVSLENIYPYENNPKEHPDKQIDIICESIKNYGFTVPILIDKNNEIIAGHGRYLASKKLNLKKVPVIKREDLNENEVKAFRIADNKLAETNWDYKRLKLELERLDFAGFEFKKTGFNPEEINDILGIIEEEEFQDKNQEIDIDSFDEFEYECPECGFEFNQ